MQQLRDEETRQVNVIDQRRPLRHQIANECVDEVLVVVRPGVRGGQQRPAEPRVILLPDAQ